MVTPLTHFFDFDEVVHYRIELDSREAFELINNGKKTKQDSLGLIAVASLWQATALDLLLSKMQRSSVQASGKSERTCATWLVNVDKAKETYISGPMAGGPPDSVSATAMANDRGAASMEERGPMSPTSCA